MNRALHNMTCRAMTSWRGLCQHVPRLVALVVTTASLAYTTGCGEGDHSPEKEDTMGDAEIPTVKTYVLGEATYTVRLPDSIAGLTGPVVLSDKDDLPVTRSPRHMAAAFFGNHKDGWRSGLRECQEALNGLSPGFHGAPFQGWSHQTEAYAAGYRLCRDALEGIRNKHGEAALRDIVQKALAADKEAQGAK